MLTKKIIKISWEKNFDNQVVEESPKLFCICSTTTSEEKIFEKLFEKKTWKWKF